MIAQVKGIIEEAGTDSAVVDVGGIGFKVWLTGRDLARLPGRGQQVRIYTSMSVREDAVELFGFAEKEELKCFKLLISVSGVGPKAAISILSGMNTQQFALCVATADLSRSSSASSVSRCACSAV